MSYAKTAWADEATAVSAANLNHIEQGVGDAYELGQWLPLSSGRGRIGTLLGTATRVFAPTFDTMTLNSAARTAAYEIIPIFATDLDVPGFITKLRVTLTIVINSQPPGTAFTLALAPVTSAGAAGGVAYTVGAALGNSATINPAGPAPSYVAGAEFGLPPDGPYMMRVTYPATTLANSDTQLVGNLEKRHVPA